MTPTTQEKIFNIIIGLTLLPEKNLHLFSCQELLKEIAEYAKIGLKTNKKYNEAEIQKLNEVYLSLKQLRII